MYDLCSCSTGNVALGHILEANNYTVALSFRYAILASQLLLMLYFPYCTRHTALTR